MLKLALTGPSCFYCFGYRPYYNTYIHVYMYYTYIYEAYIDVYNITEGREWKFLARSNARVVSIYKNQSRDAKCIGLKEGLECNFLRTSPRRFYLLIFRLSATWKSVMVAKNKNGTKKNHTTLYRHSHYFCFRIALDNIISSKMRNCIKFKVKFKKEGHRVVANTSSIWITVLESFFWYFEYSSNKMNLRYFEYFFLF